ncbi:MAG: hypothetical protein WCE38_00930 [Burkholderiales bacterium]
MTRRLIGLLTIAISVASTNAAAVTQAQAETLIGEVRAQGLLTPAVAVRTPVERERDIGLAMKIENDFSCTLIVAPLPPDSFIPLARRDNNLVEEFMLLHELAHCEQMSLSTLFQSRNLPRGVNGAYHDLALLAPWTEAIALYKEMFADTYAGAMLLARHPGSEEALVLIGEIARWRLAREQLTFPIARTHATAPALEALLETLPSAASLSPDELRTLALEIASDAFLHAISRHAFADQIALNSRGALDAARYVGWMWRAAEGFSGTRDYAHHQRIAARLTHPMRDLLGRMHAFVSRQPTPEAMRAFCDELQLAIDDRIRVRVQQASIASEGQR